MEAMSQVNVLADVADNKMTNKQAEFGAANAQNEYLISHFKAFHERQCELLRKEFCRNAGEVNSRFEKQFKSAQEAGEANLDEILSELELYQDIELEQVYRHYIDRVNLADKELDDILYKRRLILFRVMKDITKKYETEPEVAMFNIKKRETVDEQ